MKVDFLVAHPLKHHAFQLAAGCSRVSSTKLLTPLYATGIGRLLPYIPGPIGRKASGYFEPELDRDCVSAPARWQIGRLLAEIRNRDQFVARYDEHVAREVERRAIVPKVLVTLQDYMPRTVRAAKRNGAVIWSDQISNQSEQAMARIERHHKALGLEFVEDAAQIANRQVLAIADVVTVPSRYTLDGVSGLLKADCATHVIPYGFDPGTDLRRFPGSDREIVLIARANSIRKGGHLLFEALSRCGERLIELAGSDRLRVVVIGAFQDELRKIVDALGLPQNILVEDRVVPHVDMPSVLASGDLFVMPALSESMSLMCVEALGAGLPSLITPYCGVDFFEDGEMGLLVDDSVDSITAALLGMFEARDRWDAWRARSKEVARGYTWSRYRAGIEKVARLIR